MTTREILATIKATMNDNAEIVAWCDKEVAKIDHKNEYAKGRKSKVDSAKAKANADLEEIVYNAIVEMGSVKVSDLPKYPDLAEYNYPKLTPRVKALVEQGRVVCEKKGKSTMYSVATDEVVADDEPNE